MGSPPENNPTRRKALVLGYGTMAFLSVIRSLGRAGIEVHVAWFDEGEPALRSRYITAAHRIPRYRPGEPEWKDALVALMRTEEFDLVIPCDDERGLPLAAHRAELERWGKVYLPGPEALEVLGDKHKTTELARSLGVPVPREALVSDPGQGTALREEGFSPPLILKPPQSFMLEKLEQRQMVRRADSWEEVDLQLEEMLLDGPVAVQELCPGVGIGVELLLAEGTPLMAFQHVRLHEPLQGGGSSYRRSERVSEDLLEYARTLLGALRYTGVAMVEFKRDPETGGSVLVEVNARFWGSLPLALESGADFPLALFELLVEGRTEFADGHRVGICARNLARDARWHMTNLRADRTDPTLNSRPWPGVARETAVALLTGRERSDAFTLDDPAPGFAEAGRMARDLGRTGRLRAADAHARVSPRRRRTLRAAARADLRGAPRVLFVCTGNIARSPFAAAIAERSLPDGQAVASAGFLAPERPSPADAVAAAAGWSVDLTEHRSCTVSTELIRDSDAIFVFDRGNYSQMVERFPEARDRVHPFGALDVDGPLFVPDPWGGGEELYRETYRRIADTLGAAVGGDDARARRGRGQVIFVQNSRLAHHPRHHHRLAAALGGAGYDVLTLSQPDLTPGHVDSVPVEYLPVRGNRLTRIASAPLTMWRVARRRPAVVHAVTLELLPWAVLLKLLRRDGVVLYDSNDQYDSLIATKEWLPGPIRPLLQSLVRRFEPLLAGRLDGVTTAMPSTQAKFEAAGVPAVLIRNFPPVSFSPRPREKFAFDVLVGGSIHALEDILVEAAAEVARLRSQRTRWLVVARNYGPAELGELEDALSRQGLRDDFELRHDVPFTEMSELIAASRVGLVFYRGERVPQRIFEYMAAGLPFVITDSPGTSEFTHDGAAVSVPGGSPPALAAALADLLDDPDRLRQMSEAGPALARERFDWAQESEKLVGLYDRLTAA